MKIFCKPFVREDDRIKSGRRKEKRENNGKKDRI